MRRVDDQHGAKNAMYKHGLSHSPTYNTWHLMRARCRNKNAPDYHRYGGRGIDYCERWHKFDNFLEDMGIRPEGRTLDRVNNTKGYSKKNCRWATRKEQHRNTRTNRYITINGKTKALCEWIEIYKVPKARVSNRLHLGWDPERALSTPIKLKQYRFNGVEKPLTEWCLIYKKRRDTVWRRMSYGWTLKEALTIPVQ